MFGNQQNKPAGMVDDALAGFTDKKSVKRQDNDEDDDDDEDDDGSENQILTINSTDVENNLLKAPIVAEPGVEIPNDADDNSEEEIQSIETGSLADERQQQQILQDGTSNLNRNFLENLTPYDDSEDSSPQSLGDNYIPSDWLEYDNTERRKRRNIIRNERNFRKRSLRTPLEQLLNLRHSGARWKRDLKMKDEDVYGLLGLLAAAEMAKEREQERERNLDFLEAYYGDSFREPTEFDPEYGSMVADNYDLYPNRYSDAEEQAEDDYRESNPDFLLQAKKRALAYPPVDYRSLGVIGTKKRSAAGGRYPGLWGRFEEKKRFPLKRPDFSEVREALANNADDDGMDDFDEQDDENEKGSEKLYSLRDLFKGSDAAADDGRYPVYRRLI